MQPVLLDDEGVARFRRNHIVRFLLDAGPYDLNRLALMGDRFSVEDWEQFAQLIGCSVSGFGDLGFSQAATMKRASRTARVLAQKGKSK